MLKYKKAAEEEKAKIKVRKFRNISHSKRVYVVPNSVSGKKIMRIPQPVLLEKTVQKYFVKRSWLSC